MPNHRAPLRPVPVQPVSFGTCAGWLHGGRAKAAVVIAGSLGLEQLTTAAFVRLLAGRLAERGVAVLRFDWTGSGDSLGGVEALDIATCRADLDAAIITVRALTGADTLALIGLRFGALIAAMRAAGDDIDHLALLAPPSSGRQYARELQGVGRLIDDALRSGPRSDDADGLTAAGFRYSANFLEALRGVTSPDLSARAGQLSGLAVRPTGLIGAAFDVGLPDLIRHDFPGYERMMCDPTAGEVAVEVIDDVADWLAPPGARDEPQLPARAAAQPLLVAAPFREERVLFGPGDRLAGVWCQPTAVPPRQAVVFTNAGGIPHIGWARMTVDHARQLAGAGVASFRFDFAELGDSDAAVGGPRLGLYEDGPRADLAAALDWLQARGFAAATVVGICSGAHHAFQLAHRDRRVAGLVLVNILCFVWGASYALQLSAWQHTRIAGADLVAASGRSWAARLLAPLLDRARPLGKAALTQAIALPRRLAAVPFHLARMVGRPSVNPVERAVRDLVARGTWVALVAAAGDDSLAEIARYLGPAAARVTDLPGVTFDLIASADHTLTPAHARAQLGALLITRLGDIPTGGDMA